MRPESLNWGPIPGRLCNIAATLSSGQSFRWRQRGSAWLGVIADSAVKLIPGDAGFHWQTYPDPGRWELVYRYFALDVDLESLYREWVRGEPRIQPALDEFSGLRVLRQGAEEAFFSFLCSSCNTIVKITRTLRALEQRAGTLIVEIDGERFHRFPTPEAIAVIPESDLRSDLWGYRAPRVKELAAHVAAQGPHWLESLREVPYIAAHAELSGLFGIGAKLADCICLFGLAHDEAVPVDTHVRKMAVRLFRPDLAHKTLTPAVYSTLSDLIRKRFGPKAGWAQQYLFMESLNTRTPERLNA